MKDFDKSVLIGAIYDISDNNKQMNYDIRDIFLEKLVDKSLTYKIYIAHPDWTKLPRDQGESTYYVAAYKPPNNFQIDKIFKDTIFLLGESLEDSEKHLFLFTDRYQCHNSYHYRKGFLFNNIRDYSIKFHIFGIGEAYDKLGLKEMSEEYNAEYSHLSSSEELKKYLKELDGK